MPSFQNVRYGWDSSSIHSPMIFVCIAHGDIAIISKSRQLSHPAKRTVTELAECDGVGDDLVSIVVRHRRFPPHNSSSYPVFVLHRYYRYLGGENIPSTLLSLLPNRLLFTLPQCLDLLFHTALRTAPADKSSISKQVVRILHNALL